MKITTTVFLAFLLSGLGIYYALWERPANQESASELGPIRVLSFQEGDSVSRLHIFNRNAQQKFSLVRLDSGWKIESPISSPAEDFLVEGMIRVLTFSPRLRRFVWKGTEGGQDFGFRNPEIELEIETKKSPNRRTLRVGKPSPTGMGVYAQWQGEKEYFLIPHEVKASLDRSLYSLRQKKLFRANWDRIDWIQIRAENQQFRLEKSGEDWHWAIPRITKKISVEKVSELIYAFQSLYVKEFLDQAKANDKIYGLEKTSAFLAVGDRGKIEKLVLGAQAPGKDALYTRRANEDLVLLVSEQNLKTLVETFEVTFHETENIHSVQSKGSTGKNPERVPTGEKKSI